MGKYEMWVDHVADGQLFYGRDGSKAKPVAENVKPEYVKPGVAEVSEEDGVVTFIKMKANTGQTTFGAKKPFNSGGDNDSARQKMIVRQNSNQHAVKILELLLEQQPVPSITKDEAVAIVKEISEELTAWVMS
jgi:hypothetical protein